LRFGVIIFRGFIVIVGGSQLNPTDEIRPILRIPHDVTWRQKRIPPRAQNSHRALRRQQAHHLSLRRNRRVRPVSLRLGRVWKRTGFRGYQEHVLWRCVWRFTWLYKVGAGIKGRGTEGDFSRVCRVDWEIGKRESWIGKLGFQK